MKRATIEILVLVLVIAIPPPALAKNFTVPINSAREIAHFYGVYEDCSSMGESVVRITAQPQHGTAFVKLGRDHPHFAVSNPRNVCNVREVPTTQVWYKPERNYSGTDSVTVYVIFVNGATKEETITIDVR